MKSKIRNDLILICIILAISVILFIALKLTAKTGNVVEVAVDGKTVASYNLDEDTRFDIKTEGDHINTLVIKDGKAYVEYADCRDKICQNHKPVSLDGESIICLPHKVTITVSRGDEG